MRLSARSVSITKPSDLVENLLSEDWPSSFNNLCVQRFVTVFTEVFKDTNKKITGGIEQLLESSYIIVKKKKVKELIVLSLSLSQYRVNLGETTVRESIIKGSV